jgi:hypothetical protein
VQDWKDPNLRFVDVTGDGIADVLVTEDNAYTWYPSLLKEGFGEAVRVHIPLEEEKGPRVVFAYGSQSIYLADMSGDGLSLTQLWRDKLSGESHPSGQLPDLGL